MGERRGGKTVFHAGFHAGLGGGVCHTCHGPVHGVLRQQHAVQGVRRVGGHGADHVGGVDVLDRRLNAKAEKVAVSSCRVTIRMGQ